MKKFSSLDVAALAIWLLPALYLLFTWSSLPKTVAMHYNLHGRADRYGDKSEFMLFQLILMGVSAFVYLLLKFLPAIDPKKQVKYGQDTFQKLALGLVVFLTALNIAIIFAALHHGFKIEKLIFPIIGLLFAFFGNMMNSIKPNYFAGIRTPWTLENEDNWRATHRLASKIWFVGGIAIAIVMLFLPPGAATISFVGCVVIMAMVPVIYSYIYFRKHRAAQ